MSEKEKSHKILAEGEVTGHTHKALAEDAEVFGYETDREMLAPNGTDISHEEHKTITIPPGEYNITRQMEIDPDTKEIRHVSD